MDDIIIGIDLGTSNSEVAVHVDGKIEIVEENGNPILPSYVGLNGKGKIIVGDEARNQYVLYPDKTIRSIKRDMGTSKIFKLEDKEFLPQEISALILKQLKERAEKRLGKKVGKAVITVPAQFSDVQRQATKDAGVIAGLEVVRIINEPTAACLAYEQASSDHAKTILAFDLGGGTFDVSVVTVEDNVVEVISSHGDNLLGGDDMDNLICEWITKQIYDKQEKPAALSELSRLKLKSASETAKVHLSDNPHAKIIEDHIETGDKTTESLNIELDRVEFEQMIKPLLDKMIIAVHEALADAKMKPKDIDEIVLVGGSTRVPAVIRMLEEEFGKSPRQDVHPDLAVAYGAGVMASRLMGKEKQRILVDITPYTFGTSCLGYVDDEYVPYYFVPILKAGTPLPAVKAESFYTASDKQECVDVRIFQGTDEDARKNILVGNFLIEGLSKVPSGNEIVLNMRLDLDGILHVSAVEKSTNLSKHIKIEDAMGRLSNSQIEKARRVVNDLFGENPVEVDSGTGDDNTNEIDSPGELEPILKALKKKVNRFLDNMDDIDKKDSADLLEILEKSCKAGNKRKFDKASTELNDLLFYLETE